MAMSIIQDGPAPSFLSPVVYDVIAKGLCEANLSLDMIEDTNLKNIASQITNADTDGELRDVLMKDEVLEVLGKVGYRGVCSKETLSSKDNLVRSIVIKSHIEPKLALIKQLEEGLVLCGLLDKIRSRPTIFRPVFVQDETFTVNPDDFLDELKVTYSDRQQEKMAETTTFKNVCDLIEHLGHGDIGEHNVELKHLFRFITGTYSLPPLGLPELINVKFVHGCPDHCQCRPTASTCQLIINLPVHASTFDEMEYLMTSAMLEEFGFGNI